MGCSATGILPCSLNTPHGMQWHSEAALWRRKSSKISNPRETWHAGSSIMRPHYGAGDPTIYHVSQPQDVCFCLPPPTGTGGRGAIVQYPGSIPAGCKSGTEQKRYACMESSPAMHGLTGEWPKPKTATPG